METKLLKFYKVFLASSNELSTERDHFCLFIDKMNRVLDRFGYHIQVERWEIVDPEFPEERSQDVYNKILKDCDECIVLFWRKVGKYSQEELEIAYNERFGEGKLSRLVVYFKDVKDGDIPKDKKWEKEFEKLKKVKKGFVKTHGEKFYASYRDIESVESDFLLFFIDKNVPSAQLSIQESKIMLDGEEMGNISNLSLAYNNKPYQKLSKEISDLDNALRLLESTNSDNASIPLLKNQLSEKKKELQKFENSLMEIAQTITRIITYDLDNEKVALAQKQFTEGNYYEALAILNREEILSDAVLCEKDFESTKKIADQAKDKYRAAIETIVLRIQYLSVAKVKNWFNECKELYEKAVFHARNCYADAEFASLLYNYADFLHKNNKINDSICVYEEVLDIYYKLSKTASDIYLTNFATTLNDLGVIYRKTKDLSKAEVILRYALNYRLILAKKHPNSYHLPDLAGTLNNLGNLHVDQKNLSTAEKDLEKSLSIYQKLYQVDPKKYSLYVANSHNNIGRLHLANKDFISAEKEFKEALDFCRQLEKNNLDDHLFYVATTLNNLASLHYITHKYKDSEKEYSEALEIYRQLAETSPETYLSYVAITLYNFALLYIEIGNFSNADQMAQESLEKYQTMAKLSPAVFNSGVNNAKKMLEEIHAKQAKKE